MDGNLSVFQIEWCGLFDVVTEGDGAGEEMVYMIWKNDVMHTRSPCSGHTLPATHDDNATRR